MPQVSEFLFQLPSVNIHSEDSRAGLSPLAAAVTSGQRRMVRHNNNNITRLGVDKVKPKGWFKYFL